MSTRPPVTDWANDFDHLDPAWIEGPYPIWDELRRECSIAHTDRFKGVYFASRYEDVRAIADDTEHFSSRRIIVREDPPACPPVLPPITSDPPAHRDHRKVLLPAFTPDAIKRHEPHTRDICRELTSRLADKTYCDAAVDYAQEIPVRVIAHMLGVPAADGDLFRKWIHEVLELGTTDAAILAHATEEIIAYFSAMLTKRRKTPADDLITNLLRVEIGGQRLSDEHIVGTLRLLLFAGIDTTWSAIGCSLWHLAIQPADRRRLVAEPSLIPTAVEEFLRAYAPVTPAREVVKETEIAGCRFKPGEMVLLSFPAANRDPSVFSDVSQVIIDREANRHATFGLGIHRCIGSNLARMEMIVALEEWLAGIPEFTLAADPPVTWSHGIVRGPRRLPLVLGADPVSAPAVAREGDALAAQSTDWEVS
jgi:cytochrome P450